MDIRVSLIKAWSTSLAGRILARRTRTAYSVARLRVRQPRRPVACLRRKVTYNAHILTCLPKTASFGTSQGCRPLMLSDTAAATRRAHSASASSRCLLLGDDERLQGAEGINHSAGDTGLSGEGAHPTGGPFGVEPSRAQAFQRSGCANFSAGSHIHTLQHGTGGTSYYCSGAEVSPFASRWRQMLRGHVHGETLQVPRG
jgi:hypothetical protein